MNQSIKLTTSTLHIPIEVDGKVVTTLSIDPEDLSFMEKLHAFYQTVIKKAEEWEKSLKDNWSPQEDVPVDGYGMPLDVKVLMEPLEAMNSFMRGELDKLLGAGTSQAVFGDRIFRSPDVYVQLIEGLGPLIGSVREEKVKKYMPPPKRIRKRSK